MSDVTRLLEAAAGGDARAADQILPLVYEELRRLAAVRLADERVGHTLQPTALVHEAYLRLVGNSQRQPAWEGRGHFFAAAAEAMRRILVDSARRRRAEKRGGASVRSNIDLDLLPAHDADPERWILLDDALVVFAVEEPVAAELAKLRLCVGLSVEEAADALNLARATAFRHWTYARAWLGAALADAAGGKNGSG